MVIFEEKLMNIVIKKVLSVIMFFCLGSCTFVFGMGGMQVEAQRENAGVVANAVVPNNGGQGGNAEGMQNAISFVASIVAVVGLNYLLNKNAYYHNNIDPTIKRWSLFLGCGWIFRKVLINFLWNRAVQPPAGF